LDAKKLRNFSRISEEFIGRSVADALSVRRTLENR